MDLTEQNAFQYICGYLMRKCIDKHSCDVCLVYAKQYIDLDSTSYYCFFRAYNSTEDNLYGSLLMPNDEFIEYVKKLEYCFFDNIKKLMVQQKIIQKLISICNSIEFSHPCPQFPLQYLIKLYCRVRLFYTLKFINRNFKSQAGHKKMIILSHN